MRSRWIAYFAGDLRDLPPAAKRKEGPDEGADDAAAAKGGAAAGRDANGTKWRQSADRARSRARRAAPAMSASFRTGKPGQQPGAGRTPTTWTSASARRWRRWPRARCAPPPSGTMYASIRGEPRRERRGDPRIHDQQALPPVEEREATVRRPRGGRRNRRRRVDTGRQARRNTPRRRSPSRLRGPTP